MCSCNTCRATPPIMGRRWNFTTDVIGADTQGINVHDMCNAIAVKNGGNTDCKFNGEIIPAGGSKGISMHAGDEYAGRIDISFTVPAGLIDPPVNLAYLTQIFYTQGL